jgi:LPXTG-motif cell wall-anchored protein
VSILSRNIIQKEGRRWTDSGIITPAQLEQILGLYPDKKHAIGLIPILGSILVGLGILSFMAANWQDIPQLLRLLMIIALLAGFYWGGERMLSRDHEKLGIALISLGLVSFGAGIILIAQMFHLQAYDAFSWIVWGTAGMLLTYLYRSRYLYMISLLLFSIAQLYSISQFQEFSYTTLVIVLAGLGYFTWKRKDALLAWLLCISLIAQAIMLISINDWKFLWVFIPIMLLYTLGDWIKNRDFAAPFQSAAWIAAYVFDLFIVYFAGKSNIFEHWQTMLAQSLPFILISAVIFAVSMYLKAKAGRASTGFEWIIMPLLLYVTEYVDVLYLFILFFFSLYILWRGYVEEWRFKINLGTVLFLLITMTAYGKLAWNFMDKSFFFIIGGILLLTLSWFLGRRRKQFLNDSKEGTNHA